MKSTQDAVNRHALPLAAAILVNGSTWTNALHTGQRDIVWNSAARPDPPNSKIPVFVRVGAIIPLILGDDIQSLCNSNYVNNPDVHTRNGNLEIRVYASGSTYLTLYDGTAIDSVEGVGSTRIIISCEKRRLLFRILAERPQTVRLNGPSCSKHPHRATSRLQPKLGDSTK